MSESARAAPAFRPCRSPRTGFSPSRTAAAALGLLTAAAAPLRAQCPDGSPPPCARTSPGANSVAVLAFRNVTQDTALTYLTEGLSSEIATSLAGLPRLEVRSPGVVRSAQVSATADPRAVGRRLNVRYVVEGEYQRGGDRIRIAVRLVTVAAGTQRWSGAWTRPIADLLAVQEEVAREVATAIAGQLLPGERAVLASPTSSPAAWDRFLRGNFALRRRDLDEALVEYGAALALDTAFVRARARIAYAYGLLLARNATVGDLPVESLLARGTRAADQALAMDARVSDAWMARAMLAEAQDPLTLAGAREAYERAVDLDPRNEEAWHQFGSLLAYLGQDSAAFDAWRQALQLDPGRPPTIAEIARLRYYERRFADVARLCRDSISPGDETRECILVLLEAGDTAGAAAALDAMDRSHGHPHSDMRVRVGGRTPDLTTPWVQEALRQPQRTCYQVAFDRGPFWLMLGQPDSALTALESCTPRGYRVWFFLQDPVWDSLRGSPRFQRLWNETRPPTARP